MGYVNHKTANPNQLDHALAECLAPLHRFRTNQVLQTAAEDLFRTNQVWGRLPWKTGSYRPEESKLVELPAFRRFLSRELDRKEACGVIEWRGANNASFQITNYLSGSRGLALREADQPSSGTKTELRWCDWIAWSLFNSRQIAYFNPFAPIEEREKAIQDAKAMLERP